MTIEEAIAAGAIKRPVNGIHQWWVDHPECPPIPDLVREQAASYVGAVFVPSGGEVPSEVPVDGSAYCCATPLRYMGDRPDAGHLVVWTTAERERMHRDSLSRPSVDLEVFHMLRSMGIEDRP